MRWLPIIFLIGYIHTSFAQDSNLVDTAEHKLLIGLESVSFFKNNEYFSPYSKGSTNIGFILQPQAKYVLDKKSSFSIGYHFLKYSGLNSFSEAIPLFNIRYKISSSVEFIIGHIDGAVKHGLTEPHYRRDNHFQNNVEYGLQLLLSNPWLKSDLWLSWEKFIQKNDSFQEEFILGNKTSIKLFDRAPFKIKLNTEWMFGHIGGQIDYPSDTDGTLLNASFGISYLYSLNEDIAVGLDGHRYFSSVLMQISNPQNPNYYPYEKGTGVLLSANLKFKNISSQIAYWQASNYISAIGETLYTSVSDFDLDFKDDDRKLINYVVSYDKDLSEFMNVRLAWIGYYHLGISQFDYNYEVTIGLKLFRRVL